MGLKKKKKQDEDTVDTTAEKKPKKSAFVIGGNYDDMNSNVENANAQSLSKFNEYIVREGVNALMILPGMESSGGHPIITKMVHGFDNSACTRATRTDRFESCPKCDHWFKNRSSKEEKERGVKRPADTIAPSTKGLCQIVDYSWAVEHEKIKNGDAFIERAVGTEIDMEKIKERPCFMDESKFDANNEKCKTCPAFKSCFQGPQFLLLSGERTKDLMREIGRVAQKKTIKIKGKEVSLRGNISMAWWTLNPVAASGDEEDIKKAKAVARMVSFPLIITKTVDPKKDKMFGTKYDVTFERSSPFLIPASHQRNALERARDLGEYGMSGSREQVEAEFKAFLSTVESSSKPACYDNKDIKDSDECMGESCSVYKDCCSKKRDGGSAATGKTKQQARTEEIMDDDDDDDEDMKNLLKHMGVGDDDDDDDDDDNDDEPKKKPKKKGKNKKK